MINPSVFYLCFIDFRCLPADDALVEDMRDSV